MYEARRILEVGAAGLAAERASADQLAALAEEVASLFASMEDPLRFLVHDITFHRTVAAASGNPIIASLVEMVSTLYYERRRRTAERASDRDLRDAAEMHRRIYQAIRSRDAECRAPGDERSPHAGRCASVEGAGAGRLAPGRGRGAARAADPGSAARRSPADSTGAERRLMPALREAPAGQASLFDLTGRVAVVVGGTSGIGRALALGLADAGADVVATGRREALVDEVASAIEASGRRTLRQTADVGDAASLDALCDACLDQLGAVDILVTAAGVTKRVPTLAMEDADWSRIIETNLTGTLRACRAFAPPMIARRRGRIITIASLASFVGLFEVAAYTASKAAVAGLTRALAVEWAPRRRHRQRDRARACSGPISIRRCSTRRAARSS